MTYVEAQSLYSLLAAMMKLFISISLIVTLNFLNCVSTLSHYEKELPSASSYSYGSSNRSSSSSSSSSSHSSSISYNYNECDIDDGTTTTEEPNTNPRQVPNSIAIEKFYKGNTRFTANFFKNVVKENPNKSVIMSAYSTLFLLALLARFTPSNSLTREQLLKALNIDIEEVPSTIPAVIDSILEQQNATLTIATKAYGNIKSSFSELFKTDSQQILKSEGESIDFSDTKKAAVVINKWVAEKTNNKITDLVPESILTSETELVLANAFYFLGEWTYKFDPYLTIAKDFYVAENESIKIDTMRQVKYFNYAAIDNLNAKALELPYVNENLTCLIILPNDINGAEALVSKLVDENALDTVKSSLQSARVDISMPKFKTATTTNLKTIFEKLNITTLFDESVGNLINVLADSRTLSVSAAIQKATIDVNESGSEAAAANAIAAGGSSSVTDLPIPFTADHSFIYYLLFRGTPIFCGLFAGD